MVRHVTSIVLDDESRRKVDELAKNDRRDRSAEICWLISCEFERRGKQITRPDTDIPHVSQSA